MLSTNKRKTLSIILPTLTFCFFLLTEQLGVEHEEFVKISCVIMFRLASQNRSPFGELIHILIFAMLVLQCSDCQKTYAKKFLCPYFLRRNKQGNEDCWKLWNEINCSEFSWSNAFFWYTIRNNLITEFWEI